ncbi:MAG: AMP-binding protein [Actinomycetota bacterium]
MKVTTASRANLVAGRILAQSEAAPNRAALVVGDDVITYGSLLARAQQLLPTLSAAAPVPRVGILTSDPRQLLTAFLATGMAGGTCIVYDPTWTPSQQHGVLARAGADVIVADPAGRRRLRGAPDLPAMIAEPAGPTSARGTPDSTARAASDFYVGFTSGTSGAPKAFSRSQSSWLTSFRLAQEQFALSGSDWVLIPGALHHSLFLFAALQSLWMGATACILRRFGPLSLVRALQRSPITRLWAVPTMLAAAEPHLARAGTDGLQGVRGVYCTGSAWPPEQLRRCRQIFPAAEVVEFYGAGELSFVAFSSSRDRDLEPGYLRPFAEVELSIRPADPPRPGREGLIYVRSPMLFDRYLGPEPESFARDRDGWVTVGDLGNLNGQGALKVTGRATSTLICGGQNLQPEPIEGCLEQLEEVAEAAIVGVADPLWGQKPVALVRWRSDTQPLARRTLMEHCRRELGAGARPHNFLQVPSIPRTAGGKIARSQLERELSAGRLTTQGIT